MLNKKNNLNRCNNSIYNNKDSNQKIYNKNKFKRKKKYPIQIWNKKKS